MSVAKETLCGQVLSELCGPWTASVAQALASLKLAGPAEIGQHIQGSKRADIRQALAVLYQHGFLQDESLSRFTLDMDQVLLCLRYPRYLYVAKTLFGNQAELLVEEILLAGSLVGPCTLVSRAFRRLPDGTKEAGPDRETVKQLFTTLLDLASRDFVEVRRNASSSGESDSDNVVSSHKLIQESLDVDEVLAFVRSLHDSTQSKKKSDAGPLFGVRLNFDRFHEAISCQTIAAAASRRIDASAGLLMRLIVDELHATARPSLSTMQITTVVRRHATEKASDVSDALRQLQRFTEQYIRVLEEDESRFLQRVGDENGGMFTVNRKLVFTQLATALVEDIVKEKLSSKALRIFRLVMEKRYIEESQIQARVMIPSKETKLLTYALLESHFVQLQELKKSLGGNVQAKTFYLFHVDFNQVCRMSVELCYKSLANLHRRMNFERTQHQRILEKQERVDSIAASLNQANPDATTEELNEQLQEIQEMISPPEQDLIRNVHRVSDRLTSAIGQVDETLFILQTYLSLP